MVPSFSMKALQKKFFNPTLYFDTMSKCRRLNFENAFLISIPVLSSFALKTLLRVLRSGRVMRWCLVSHQCRRGGGWSGGAMVLGNLPVPERHTCLDKSREGPTALAVGAGGGGGCLDIFTLIYPFSSRSTSLWETTRYRL